MWAWHTAQFSLLLSRLRHNVVFQVCGFLTKRSPFGWWWWLRCTLPSSTLTLMLVADVTALLVAISFTAVDGIYRHGAAWWWETKILQNSLTYYALENYYYAWDGYEINRERDREWERETGRIDEGFNLLALQKGIWMVFYTYFGGKFVANRHQLKPCYRIQVLHSCSHHKVRCLWQKP